MAKSMKQEKPASDVRASLLEGQEEVASTDEATAVPTDDAATESDSEAAGTAAETTEPVVDASAAEGTEAAAAEPKGFIDRVRELGYQGDDESEAMDTLIASYRRLATERQQWEQRVKETEELARFGTEYLQQQRQEEAPSQPAEETPGEQPWWNPPTLDPAMVQRYQEVTLGEDGQPKLGWKSNTPRELQQAAEQYSQYLEQWATDLVQRPQEVLPKIIEQEFDRLFERRIKERDEEQQLATFAERVRETNRDWMFTKDEQGREVFTAEGQLVTNFLAEAAEKGMTSPQDQWEYAVYKYDYLNRAKQASAAQASQTAQQTAAQKRRQQAAQGAGRPNRTGTVPRPDEESTRSQNPNLTPGQKLLQQLRLDGADV